MESVSAVPVKSEKMSENWSDRCPLQGRPVGYLPSDHQADCPFYGIPSEVPDGKAAAMLSVERGKCSTLDNI